MHEILFYGLIMVDNAFLTLLPPSRKTVVIIYYGEQLLQEAIHIVQK